MNERNQKIDSRASNQTSSLAVELLARTLERAAKLDNDPGAAKLAQKAREYVKLKEK